MKQVLNLLIKGQVRGGKNNMGMTRSGIHYPKPEFVKWRKETMSQITAQLPKDFKPFDSIDYAWGFVYTPGDNRRRDLPAILDALFHCLERAGVVTDDSIIKNVKFYNMQTDKTNPSCEITCYYD